MQRCISKKLPGAEPVEYEYDSCDRLSFSQDGNQRPAGRWTYYLYDAFGRLTEQGECSSKNLSSGRTAHVRNFYDGYAAFREATGYDSAFHDDTSGYAHGALTGSVTTSFGSDTPVFKAYYYDNKGRTVKVVESNLLGGYETTGTVYTLTDKPLTVTHTHTGSGKLTRTETYAYTYDHADRLSRVEHTLDGAKVTLVANAYDEWGRLSSRTFHGSSTNSLAYTYNIRGWLTEIGGGKFTQDLYYNTGNGTLCYNGNISSMTWKTGNESNIRGYKFDYDGVNRLASAMYGETASIDSNTDRFTERVTGYDSNGNITGLQRYGQTSVAGYGLVDNLSFTLDGNRLNRVDDATTASAYNGSFEFKDGASQAGEYTYDANGNLTKDLNKNIIDIQYNVLNLPSKVVFSDGSVISYVYAADGTKLRTVHTIGGAATTTDYCGNVVYENGVQKLLLTETGYVTLNDKKYHYYLQDHQGNNRVVMSQDGSVEETNHYYPFGGVFASSGNVQPYKYNGKELDTKKGLDWYDYGARQYDAALGRFTTVDPMAEKYYPESPYSYCGNNPIMFIDPDGHMKVIYNPDGTYKETTHNNWFHNTFIGRQEYIAYKEGNVKLSEQEFWNWQRTGSYSSIQGTGNMTNIEFTLDEPAKGVVDGISKFILSSVYSLVNSPKVVLTGRTWSGASQTSTETMGAFIDVVSNNIPFSKMSKVGNPGSWYKFKKANKHIPALKRKGVYNAEVRRYEGKTRNIDIFNKEKNTIETIKYTHNQQNEEE